MKKRLNTVFLFNVTSRGGVLLLAFRECILPPRRRKRSSMPRGGKAGKKEPENRKKCTLQSEAFDQMVKENDGSCVFK